MIPSAYYSSWRAVSNASPGMPDDSVYCPGSTQKLARLYGVSFVLERAGLPDPGRRLRTALGTKTSIGSRCRRGNPHPVGSRRPAAAGQRPGDAHWGDPSEPLVVEAALRRRQPTGLRLRLTDVPGWNATIDGRPVPLQNFAGVMLQLKVPAGRHTIELNYWPATFTIGLVLAGCAVVGLAGAFALTWQRHRATRIDARSSSDP